MMMKIKWIIPVVIFFAACDSKDGNRTQDEFGVPYPDVKLNEFNEKLSYGMGADIGANFNNMPKEMFETMNTVALESGFFSGLSGEESDRDDCQGILSSAFSSNAQIDTTQFSMESISDCYGFLFGDMLRKNLSGKDALESIDFEFARIGFAHALYEVDTLIPLDERSKMVADFNNDMAKQKGERLLNEVSQIEGVLSDEKGWVLKTIQPGNGEPVKSDYEYNILYTLMNANRDTIVSTFIDAEMSDEANAQIINTDDIVIPNGWTLAASSMEVNGEYELFLPYDLAYGERGLMNQNSTSYIIQPYSAVIISSRVLEQNEMHAFAKSRGAKIIEEAKKNPNTIVGKSGYVLETLREGEGDKVTPGSDVQAHYILTNSSGDIVENSYDGAAQGRPAPAFSLNGVIQGWQDAVPQMRKGGKYRLYLPYDIAYGERGNQGISPYETLTFEMEILDFGKPGSLVQQRPQGM